MKLKSMFGMGLVAMLLAGSMSAAFAQGSMHFYEMTGGTYKKQCTLHDGKTQRYNLGLKRINPCEDNEIRSVVLENVKAGTKMRLYDNNWGHKDDSWAELTVKQPHPHYVLHSFRSNYEDEFVKAEYHKSNHFKGRHGMNDQISRIEIDEPTPLFK